MNTPGNGFDQSSVSPSMCCREAVPHYCSDDFPVQLFYHRAAGFEIRIGAIELDVIEFLEMLAIDALVAKHAANLKNTLIASDEKPLQRKLERDAEVEVLIERVMMRDEWLGLSPARYMLEHGRLDFDKPARRKEGAHRLPERVFLHEELAVSPDSSRDRDSVDGGVPPRP